MADIPLRSDPKPSPLTLARALRTELGDRFQVMLLGGHAAVATNIWTAVRVRAKRGKQAFSVRPLMPAPFGLLLAEPLAYWLKSLVPVVAWMRLAIHLAGAFIAVFAGVRILTGLYAALRLRRDVAAVAARPEFASALDAAAHDATPIEVEPTIWEVVREAYVRFDRRTLGFARILLGVLLVGDLFRRTWDWADMYSTIGVLPNHLNLFRPQGSGNFSIVNAFSSPGELWVLWAVMLVTFVCVLVGYKTKLAQVLALVWVTSLDGRVLLIENGGYVVYNLLLLWTCFLPMADRFSVDAMLASMRKTRETNVAELNDRSNIVEPRRLAPHYSLLGFVLMVQLAAIYYFNVIHKTGPAWHNGTAVHYVMYVDRMVNPIVGLTRTHIPRIGYQLLTRFTIAAETTLPFALLAPVFRAWARRLAIVLIDALHIGFGTAMVLGPFAWALCVFSTLLFSTDDWEIAIATMRRSPRARIVAFDAGSGGAMLACRILKRMDRFELLTFRASETGRFYVEMPLPEAPTAPGLRRTGALAFADVVAALPLGPCIAWIFRLPGLRPALDSLGAWLERGRLSSYFGLTVAGRARPPIVSPLRRARMRAFATLREIGIAIMFVGAINQALVELWAVNRRWRAPHPEPIRLLAHKLRFLQGWFMFSPNPVMDDGTIIVDAVTIDGRHIDPFTHKPPNFDLIHVRSYGYNQIWSDYFNRMHLPANTTYRDAMRDYMLRLPERTGNPNDAIVSGDVYWVQDMNPKWGETESYKFERNKLFSFENPALKDRVPPEPPITSRAPGP